MIMVVTFQEDLRNNITSFLSKKGYEVCVPPHRQDVSSMVKEKNPLVIVLDMYVAEPNGVQVMKELRAQQYTGKFVVMAGTSVSQVIPQAMSLGIDQVVGGPQGIGGPMQCEQVEGAIRMALHPVIAARAFELYETRGRINGKDLDDWLEAERQILTRTPSSPSSVPKGIQTESEGREKRKGRTNTSSI